MRNRVPAATRRKRYIIISILATLVIGAAITVVLLGRSDSPEKQAASPIPKAIQAEADFPLYYPDSRQQKWRIEDNSFQNENGVVLYIVTGPSGSINVSQQAKPQEFDFEKFHKKVLTGGTLLATQIGTGAIGKAEDKLIGSVVTDKTWILLTPANPAITQTQLIEISSHLKTD